jgi:hypothetical protein
MGLFRGEIICHRRNNGKLKRIRSVPACSAEDDRTYRQLEAQSEEWILLQRRNRIPRDMNSVDPAKYQRSSIP